MSAELENEDALDMGGHWVCERQKDIMELIEELGGIEYYPQNITGLKMIIFRRK